MEQQAVEQLIKRRIADKQERIQQIGRQIWTHAEWAFANSKLQNWPKRFS